jgi:hypothetical protein
MPEFRARRNVIDLVDVGIFHDSWNAAGPRRTVLDSSYYIDVFYEFFNS